MRRKPNNVNTDCSWVEGSTEKLTALVHYKNVCIHAIQLCCGRLNLAKLFKVPTKSEHINKRH